MCLTCHEEVLKCAKKQISDLEAKLAESKEILVVRKWEIDDLKQQLAEKDEVIKELEIEKEYIRKNKNIFLDALMNVAKKCQEKEKEIEELKKSKTYIMNFGDKVKEVTIQDQDKISFAVEQLEKVKEYIHKHKVNPVFADRYIIYVKSLNDYIDNQIASLKKGVE